MARAAITVRYNGSMPVDVLCIRHGLSTWNLARRWQGRADPPLSDEGRRGAMGLGAELRSTLGTRGPVVVWSSPLRRSTETARIIADALGAPPVVVDERLGELDVGPWQGLTTDEIDASWPGMLASHERPPGFEDDASVLARVLPALADIAGTVPPGAVALVVGHAGVLRSVRRHCAAPDERLANLDGWWFAVEPDGSAVRYIGDLDVPGDTVVPGPHR